MVDQIDISFAELRQITYQIINLVSETTGYEKSEISIGTAINNDLGIDGDDWDDVLVALFKKENLRLEGLNFYDYFNDEAQIANSFGLDLLSLLIKILSYLLPFIGGRVNWDRALRLKAKPDLTIGDLITSKVEGHFVKRTERKFRLITT